MQSLMFITLFSAVILFLQYFAVKKCLQIFDIPMNIIWYRMICAGALSVPAVMIVARMYPSVLTKILSLLMLSYIGTVWIVFWCCVVWAIFLCFIPKNMVVQVLFSCMTVSAVIWAFYEGNRLHLKQFVVSTPSVKEPVRMIHLTDIHAGHIHADRHVIKISNVLQQLDADIIAITGDFVDSSDVSHEVIASVACCAPICLFCLGNHDKYSGEGGVLAEIEKAGIIHLNGTVHSYKGICVGGIDNIYPGSEQADTVLQNIGFSTDSFNVLLSHQPPHFESILKTSADLTLSGHTHNGQIFPFGLFGKLFYPNIYGIYEQQGHLLYVGSGTGTWGPPMRLFTKNEIVVFDIFPGEIFQISEK